jgi:hypothetical protein
VAFVYAAGAWGRGRRGIGAVRILRFYGTPVV